MDLGLADYLEVFELQKKIVSDKIAERSEPDTLLLVEHPAVYTLGKRGGRENLNVSEAFISKKNIRIIATQRGGDITFHGPGQLVFYPIMDLHRANLGVADFVYRLETVMIRTCRDAGIVAERNPKNHGIWVGDQKIGSVGLGVKHGITYHGLALNVITNLEPFSWINPCGLASVSMTSVETELKALGASTCHLNMARIKQSMLKHFLSITG